MKTNRLVIHPYLFAVNPILSLFLRNRSQVSFLEVALPIAFFLAITFLLSQLARIFLRERKKAGVAVSIFIILFFSYRSIYVGLKGLQIGSFIVGTSLNILLAEGVIFAFCFVGVVKKRSDFPTLTSYLNIYALILILVSTYNIGIHEFKRAKVLKNSRYLKNLENNSEFNLTASNQGLKPDIYYIILDTYARADTLKTIYGYNNSKFVNTLETKGFYIASKSRSNYTFTQLSLASSLNMEYLNYLGKLLGKNSRNPSLPYQMISNNKVGRFLKAKGYKFVHFSTGWGPTKRNKLADIEYSYLPYVFDEFNRVLLESTALAPFIRPYILAHSRNRILYNFEKLGELPKMKKPTFAFAHLIIPHQPYLFDRMGRPVSVGRFEMGGDVWKYKKEYLDQLIFANKKVIGLVNKILSESEEPPIIILQSDHGPSSTRGWDKPSKRLLNERMNILNAYYLPGRGRSVLYESITPVNSFRLIFNYYFDTEYKMLKDESYFSTKVQPYRFINVTEKLKASQN